MTLSSLTMTSNGNSCQPDALEQMIHRVARESAFEFQEAA